MFKASRVCYAFTMTANARGLIAGALAMSVALVLIGLGLDLYENNKFSDCVNATGTIAHCATANRGGLIVFGVGLIGLIGAGTVWLVLRKSMVKAN